MRFTYPGFGEPAVVHEGYVAGRYRNGTFSDIWTDVARCAEATFTGYAAACECGWRGPTLPATDEGHDACQRMWVHEHIRGLDTVEPPRTVIEQSQPVGTDALL